MIQHIGITMKQSAILSQKREGINHSLAQSKFSVKQIDSEGKAT